MRGTKKLIEIFLEQSPEDTGSTRASDRDGFPR